MMGRVGWAVLDGVGLHDNCLGRSNTSEEGVIGLATHDTHHLSINPRIPHQDTSQRGGNIKRSERFRQECSYGVLLLRGWVKKEFMGLCIYIGVGT